MLRISAVHGRHVMFRLSQTVAARGAPHSLQKTASSTTTALPHREQKRGGSTIRASGIEGQNDVAEAHRDTAGERCLANSLLRDPDTILATLIANYVAAIARLDHRVMA